LIVIWILLVIRSGAEIPAYRIEPSPAAFS
jgi:hypothetical protein